MDSTPAKKITAKAVEAAAEAAKPLNDKVKAVKAAIENPEKQHAPEVVAVAEQVEHGEMTVLEAANGLETQRPEPEKTRPPLPAPRKPLYMGEPEPEFPAEADEEDEGDDDVLSEAELRVISPELAALFKPMFAVMEGAAGLCDWDIRQDLRPLHGEWARFAYNHKLGIRDVGQRLDVIQEAFGLLQRPNQALAA